MRDESRFVYLGIGLFIVALTIVIGVNYYRIRVCQQVNPGASTWQCLVMLG